jgi:hypothetical protein
VEKEGRKGERGELNKKINEKKKEGKEEQRERNKVKL